MPDTFNRVDANKLRVIGVVIGPNPEVSPGDTVTATAYFGGNGVVSISDVKLAHQLVWGTDGMSVMDSYPVTVLSQPIGLPDSAEFSFVISPDVFIGRHPYDSIAQSTVDSMAKLLSRPKDSVTAILSSMSDSQKTAFADIIEKMVLPTGLIFTARSANGTALEVAAQFTIKYHFGLSGITPPNVNPNISWVGIAAVHSGDALGFNFYDPANVGKYTMTYLFNKNNPALCDSVIDIDTGFAYFLASDSGISKINLPGDSLTESYSYKWFYQNVNVVSADDSSLMQIDDNGSACIEMKPPDNTAMKTFRAWVVAYNRIENEPMDPLGMCVRGVQGTFRFSSAYQKSKSE